MAAAVRFMSLLWCYRPQLVPTITLFSRLLLLCHRPPHQPPIFNPTLHPAPAPKRLCLPLRTSQTTETIIPQITWLLFAISGGKFCSIWRIFESLYSLRCSVLPSVVGASEVISPRGFSLLSQLPSPTSPPPTSSTFHPHFHAPIQHRHLSYSITATSSTACLYFRL